MHGDCAGTPSKQQNLPLCHLAERWEDEGDADSCMGAGTHGGQKAGSDHWLLVGFLCLQPLQQPGQVVDEEDP